MRSETMSGGTQVDLDWAGTEAGQATATSVPAPGGAAGERYLTDEEILGIEPVGASADSQRSAIPSEARNRSSVGDDGDPVTQRDSSAKDGPRNGSQMNGAAKAAIPDW